VLCGVVLRWVWFGAVCLMGSLGRRFVIRFADMLEVGE
jgi:hypothetical protein